MHEKKKKGLWNESETPMTFKIIKLFYSAKHYSFLAFTCSVPVQILTLACKYELSGIAQKQAIHHLFTARVPVIWSLHMYKILFELHSQEINDHDNRLPLMLHIMKLHKSGSGLLHAETRVHVRYFQLYERPWLNSLFCSGQYRCYHPARFKASSKENCFFHLVCQLDQLYGLLQAFVSCLHDTYLVLY